VLCCRSGAEGKGLFFPEKPVAGFGNLDNEGRGAVPARKFLIERGDELTKLAIVGEGIVASQQATEFFSRHHLPRCCRQTQEALPFRPGQDQPVSPERGDVLGGIEREIIIEIVEIFWHAGARHCNTA
jgi:hypothetical protein